MSSLKNRLSKLEEVIKSKGREERVVFVQNWTQSEVEAFLAWADPDDRYEIKVFNMIVHPSEPRGADRDLDELIRVFRRDYPDTHFKGGE